MQKTFATHPSDQNTLNSQHQTIQNKTIFTVCRLKSLRTIETNSRSVFHYDPATTLASLQNVQITETTAPLIKTLSDLLLSQQHLLD